MSVRSLPHGSRGKAIIRALERGRVCVGIPAEARGTDAEGRPIQYAGLGYVFENGAPEINMPARPWLVPGVDSTKDEIQRFFKDGAVRMFSGGEISEYEKTLQKVGLIAVGAIQQRIASGIAPPLSERTIYARLHRKKNRRKPGPMTPLIDTSGFLRSIKYIVKT